MEYRPSEVTADALGAYERLFRACFPVASTLDTAYLEWLYTRNPAGSGVGFDAWEGDALAAHYACIPAQAVVNGRECRVLLSLNTATHPDFQGKGLFTRLAELTYGNAGERGFDAVYGIANANSTPGFLRKLGFTLVSPLDARIGAGRISAGRGVGVANDNGGFKRIWQPASLAWRISNPKRPYRLVEVGGDVVGAQCPAGKPGLVAWAEIPRHAAAGMQTGSPSLALHLHLGLRPAGERRAGKWIDIPRRLRPSPLNMIFRSLGEATATIDAERVTLGQLDFDAF